MGCKEDVLSIFTDKNVFIKRQELRPLNYVRIVYKNGDHVDLIRTSNSIPEYMGVMYVRNKMHPIVHLSTKELQKYNVDTINYIIIDYR